MITKFRMGKVALVVFWGATFIIAISSLSYAHLLLSTDIPVTHRKRHRKRHL